MIGFTYDGSTEASDIANIVVDVESGNVTVTYKVMDGYEIKYCSISVGELEETSDFVTAVVATAITAIDSSIG